MGKKKQGKAEKSHRLFFIKAMLAKGLHISRKAADTALRSLLMLVTLVTVSIMAPKVHGLLVRKYVGSKVVMLTNVNPSKLQRGQGFGGGTGYHIKAPSGKTYIMTNRHVCEMMPENEIFVNSPSGAVYAKKIIERDTNTDLCLVEGLDGVSGLDLSSGRLSYGQTVAAIGHPELLPVTMTMGEVIGPESVNIGLGIIGRDLTQEACLKYNNRNIQTYGLGQGGLLLGMVEVCTEHVNAIVTTVPIYHGSSGSPVVNFWGKVVGTMFAIGEEGFWGRFVTATSIKDLLKGR